ncbi:N-acetylmuramic acid 6-phosphate etherase [Bacillus sp. FSL K6-3431]|uniref:N-acetylmuramic acid 6-phosphate etherase n=1 Tax=Bacillus sp. FSL K6-3431 TaxID=2921500 RepID=UPI0030F6E24B
MTLEKLITEQRNENSMNLDSLSTIQMITLINEEDKKVAVAVEKELLAIGEVIDVIVNQLSQGGRLIYIGAGTSGRVGIVDSVECKPTFGTINDEVIGIIAGGKAALINAQEGSEDSEEDAIHDLKSIQLSQKDCLIGIAASGRTPYVVSAITYANQLGATTIALSSNKGCYIGKKAKMKIEVETGSEVLTGSTRMKAATAHKMVLNMISTGSMVKLGKVYENLMVDVQITNEKLYKRALSILKNCLDIEEQEAKELLEAAKKEVKTAIIMKIKQMGYEQAKAALLRHDNHIRNVLRKE